MARLYINGPKKNKKEIDLEDDDDYEDMYKDYDDEEHDDWDDYDDEEDYIIIDDPYCL